MQLQRSSLHGLTVSTGASRRPPAGMFGAVGDLQATYDEVNRAPLEALGHLVARANALVAAVLRLGSVVPFACLTPGKGNRLTPLLWDFAYFKNPAMFEARLDDNRQLLALEEQLQQDHREVLEESYAVFEGLAGYHADLALLLRQLRDGVFLQCSLETLLLGHEGRQLALESVSLLGVLMLLLDRTVPGPIRERMVVAYFRYKGGAQAVGPTLNHVITLCSCTALHPRGAAPPPDPAGSRPHPQGYPEQYLARLPLPVHVVPLLVDSLKSDDVYNQIGHYPNPQHRTAALGQQAGHLYVLLFMVPGLLSGDAALMRMLVDRHFSDNWVVAWGPGLTADLALEWEHYKAAKAALSGLITAGRARSLASAASSQLPDLRRQLAQLMSSDGRLAPEQLLHSTAEVFSLLRSCNVALRWLLLHRAGCNRRLTDAVLGEGPSAGDVARLLLDTASAEFEVKRQYGELLGSRRARWERYRRQVEQQLRELSEFYNGGQVLGRALADEALADWFVECAARVAKLGGTARTGNGGGPPAPSEAVREIRRLLAAMHEVATYHKVESSLQALQHLADIQSGLRSLVALASAVREELMGTLVVASDLSYGWGLLPQYTAELQAHLRSDPAAVLSARCLFLKARSYMEPPLLRLSQAGSRQTYAVGRFYSRRLLAWVRDVMQVVPVCVFEVLHRIVELQANKLRPLPSRVCKGSLGDYAQPGERAELAALVHRAAAFAQGVMAMERTFVGVIELDPRTLLHDGIRRQLRRTLADACDDCCRLGGGGGGGPLLTFSLGGAGGFGGGPPAGASPLSFVPLADLSASFSGEMPGHAELPARLTQLTGRLRSMQAALGCVQDVMQLHGLAMWQQEYTQLVRDELKRELTRLGSYVVDDEGCVSEAVLHLEHGGLPLTFLGRVAAELLRLSDPLRSCYRTRGGSWADAAGNVVVGPTTMRLLSSALEVQGLGAIDCMLCCRITQALQWLLSDCRRALAGSSGKTGSGDASAAKNDAAAAAAVAQLGAACRRFEHACGPTGGYPLAGLDAYTEAEAALGKAARRLACHVSAIGQGVLLRRAIALQLRCAAELQACPALPRAAGALDAALMRRHSGQAQGMGWAQQAAQRTPAGTQRQQQQQCSRRRQFCQPDEVEADLWKGLGDLLQTTGQHQPVARKIYCHAPASLPHMGTLVFLVMLVHARRYSLGSSTNPVAACGSNTAGGDGYGGVDIGGGGVQLQRTTKRGAVDGPVLATGLGVLLRHCGDGVADVAFAYVGQCVRALAQGASTAACLGGGGGLQESMAQQAAVLLVIARQTAAASGLGPRALSRHVPPALESAWLPGAAALGTSST